eukprot:COSAG06_NODE_81_length_25302_cov_21.168902_8_plen_78_part_00
MVDAVIVLQAGEPAAAPHSPGDEQQVSFHRRSHPLELISTGPEVSALTAAPVLWLFVWHLSRRQRDAQPRVQSGSED